MTSDRDAANTKYMAWLMGCDGLLSAEDDAVVRSEAGWTAYLAGYMAALASTAQPAVGEADHLWSHLSRPENRGMSVLKACCTLPQSAHAGVSWAEVIAMMDDEPLTENEWGILYRLLDQYTESAYADLPKDDPSHVIRRLLRRKVVHYLIAARERERAAMVPAAGPGGDAEGG